MNELDRALGERDRARDFAAALEADCADQDNRHVEAGRAISDAHTRDVLVTPLRRMVDQLPPFEADALERLLEDWEHPNRTITYTVTGKPLDELIVEAVHGMDVEEPGVLQVIAVGVL